MIWCGMTRHDTAPAAMQLRVRGILHKNAPSNQAIGHETMQGSATQQGTMTKNRNPNITRHGYKAGMFRNRHRDKAMSEHEEEKKMRAAMLTTTAAEKMEVKINKKEREGNKIESGRTGHTMSR